MIQYKTFKSLQDAGKLGHLPCGVGWLFLENPRVAGIPRIKGALATEILFIWQKTDIFHHGNFF